jgi:type II secretory pathway pseudopilin PulG
MKHTKGFTLIELVVACTLLMMLSTLATATADNFIQIFKATQATNKLLTYRTQIYGLKFMLAQAQLLYAAQIANQPGAIATWNTQVAENDITDLILQLVPYIQNLNPNAGSQITNYTTLLQAENMYDPTGVNNPTILLGSYTFSNPATLVGLPTVTWQGVML